MDNKRTTRATGYKVTGDVTLIPTKGPERPERLSTAKKFVDYHALEINREIGGIEGARTSLREVYFHAVAHCPGMVEKLYTDLLVLDNLLRDLAEYQSRRA